MIVYLAIQNPTKIVYEARAEIKPISTFDEFEYEIYNSYLKNTGRKTIKYPLKFENENFLLLK